MKKVEAKLTPKKAVTKNATAKKAVVESEEEKLTIMVSSTVYDSQDVLHQVKAILEQKYGYKVIMSMEGNVYVPVDFTPEEACLKAVDDCDLFFGIIFPRYGSGITHKEFIRAVESDKPRWFVAHEKIEFVRKLLEPKMYTKKGVRTKFRIRKTSVLDDIQVVDMYNAVRKNWVQSFSTDDELLSFIDTQFQDSARRAEELAKRKKKRK